MQKDYPPRVFKPKSRFIYGFQLRLFQEILKIIFQIVQYNIKPTSY